MRPQTLLAAFATSAASLCSAEPASFRSWAPTPPMGWNSWDYYGTSINEEQARAQAAFQARELLPFGWDYFVVDIQWYEPRAKGHHYRDGAELEMDEHGRLLPAPNRFPSAADGAGFKPLADHIHSLGLKFGVHLMRGIPRQAVERNVPILGTNVRAADIADRSSTCPWNPDMFGVDTTKPGAQEYYDSVFALFASWGVDYVKVDDLSRPYHRNEVEAIRKAIDRTGRPIVLSLSPGETPLSAGPHVVNHANLWRISDDFWDRWLALHEQFARLRNWNPHRVDGAWPDADMLPLGWLSNGERQTRFTRDEQITLMTLWSIARSPLMHGGDMTRTDPFTQSLLTNPEVIAVNQRSANNRPLFEDDDLHGWVADVPGTQDKYLALFNARDAVRLVPSNAAFTSARVGSAPGLSEQVDVSVEGGTRLFLQAGPAGAGDLNAQVFWKAPRLRMKDGSELDLTVLKWNRTDATWDSTRLKRDAQGNSLGIQALSPMFVEFNLPEGAERFLATVSLDPDSKSDPAAGMRFLVVVDKAGSTAAPASHPVTVQLESLGIRGSALVRDLWARKDLGDVKGSVTADIPWHGAVLYRISPR